MDNPARSIGTTLQPVSRGLHGIAESMIAVAVPSSKDRIHPRTVPTPPAYTLPVPATQAPKPMPTARPERLTSTHNPRPKPATLEWAGSDNRRSASAESQACINAKLDLVIEYNEENVARRNLVCDKP